MKFLLTFTLVISAGYLLVEGCIPATDPNCTADNFDPVEYCKWCVTIRQGKQFHMDPFHHSYYYQCDNGPLRRECGPCTYWLDKEQTCGHLWQAKAQYPAGDKYRIRQPYGHTCNRYYNCDANGGYTIECCDGAANYFDKENAQYDPLQPACVTNEACNEICYATQGPIVTQTTPTGQIYEVTCTPKIWPFGYHLLAGTEPPCYLILNADGTSVGGRYCCAVGQTFDTKTCSCKNPEVSLVGCLKVNLPMDQSPITDVAGKNYVDQGDVTVTANGRGSFSGEYRSSLEIPFFFNKFPYVNEMTISVWFKKHGNGDIVGLVSNGNCEGNGSVNIWVQGNKVLGGVLTGDLTDVLAAMMTTQVASISNEWHNVVLTYKKQSNADSQYSLYLDGALVGTKAGKGAIVQSSAPLIIGRQFCLGDITCDGFEGLMDNFRYYECYMTAAQVQDLYNAQLPNFP